MEPTLLEILYYIFLGLITSGGQVLIFILSIYYWAKTGSKVDSILLVVGSSISLITLILIQIGVLYASVWGKEVYLQFTYLTQGISFIGSLLFVIGFFLLIRKIIKYTLHISKTE